MNYALGLDYGTSSVRALIVRCEDGAEIGTAVWPYSRGEEGVITDPKDVHLARQHPQDYVDGLYNSVKAALIEASQNPDFSPSRIVGIGVDTTGSTPIPVDAECQPLTDNPLFANNPHAMAWLWKDHTSTEEAAEITRKSKELGYPYMDMVGGTYSSEWFWAKILRCARVAPDVFEAAASWVELCDFVPSHLVGAIDPATLKRGICAAGHKALFNEDWGGLPSEEFLAALDPRLAKLRPRVAGDCCPSDQLAGRLAPEAAAKLGLTAGIAVAVGAFDAHMGAVGSGVQPSTLVKIIGTSTCDIMVAPLPSDGKAPFIPGMCGVVKGSVLPEMLGIEAGQSAVGDLFNWFVKHLAPNASHESLAEEAAKLKPGESGLLALDWNNGNRTILVDQRLSGLLIGQTLATSAPEIYRALLEATAFGALVIIERMEEYGTKVEQIVNCGGIAEKSPLTMQIYADVCDRPMKLSRSAQTCALGAAMFASVVGGAHSNITDAQGAMGGLKETVYQPDPNAVAVYRRLFSLYRQLHDSFGGVSVNNLSHIMKDLLEIAEKTSAN